MTQSEDSVLDRQWFTPNEVQVITGVSRTEVYAALQTGDLEGHQRSKSRAWRIHKSAIDRWMRGQSAKQTA